MLGNLLWLVMGKGFGGICSLGYLAILSRSLGLDGFGHFSLIFATAQALVAIVGFQTWQAVVRYGTIHIEARAYDSFGRVAMLGGVLDALGALAGCILAYLIFEVFGHALGISDNYITVGFAFSCAILWARVSAPTGVLRALGRFDRAVYVEALVPIARLLAATAIWLTGASVVRFLIAWALIDLLSALVYWLVAWRACPRGLTRANLQRWRDALAENPGIARFLAITYVGPSLEAVTKQGPMLLVGAVLGSSSAGLYRLADQVVQGFGKLSTLAARSIYAEIARAHAAIGAAEFRRLALRTSIIGAVAGVVTLILALTGGKVLLEIIGGADFERGAPIMMPLAIAVGLELASVAYEPVMHAAGHPFLVLAARLCGIVALGVAMTLLITQGIVATAWAVAIGGTVSYLALSLLVRRVLFSMEHAIA